MSAEITYRRDHDSPPSTLNEAGIEDLSDRANNPVTHLSRYIWHTIGSGKTLTSLKASTLPKDYPKIALAA